jgi:phosphate transport system substrate-binding protein
LNGLSAWEVNSNEISEVNLQMKKSFIVVLLVALSTCQSALAQVQSINGAGSSAAAPIYRSWAREYQKVTGVIMNYEPVGSSAGVKKISAREIDFGASDVAPPDAELAKSGLIAFPIAITGVAPVVNLPNVIDGQLRLTGPVLASIFLGEISKWNAPEISDLNPGINFPNRPIKVVVRSDGSGTTYNFADYLARVSAQWKEKYGVKSLFTWPEAFLAVKGSNGVVKAIRETEGAIGYVDYGYVKDFKLSSVQIKNASGEFLAPSSASFKAALNASEWTSKGTFNGTLIALTGKNCWPITMGTFAVLPLVTDKQQATQRALRFFVWAFLNGDALVQESNFVRLPDRVQASAFKAINGVKDTSGNSLGSSLMVMAN